MVLIRLNYSRNVCGHTLNHSLGIGVTVAQQTLDLLVVVQIYHPQLVTQ